MVRMITAAAALTIAGSAMAVPTGAHWEMVDNSGNINGSAGLDASWMTFDLFVDFEAGDVVSAADFGIAGGNIGLSTDGTLFNGGAFGGDSVADNVGFAALVPNLEYHHAVTVNGGALGGFAQAMDWNPAGITGAWFVNPAQAPAAGNSMWLARITVSNDTTFLGGEIFVSGSGPGGEFGQQDPATGVVAVPNAKIPTPGALALFGLAGAAATRRRR